MVPFLFAGNCTNGTRRTDCGFLWRKCSSLHCLFWYDTYASSSTTHPGKNILRKHFMLYNKWLHLLHLES